MPLFPVDLHHAYEVFCRSCVDLPSVLPRINEGTEAHLGDRAGSIGGHVSVQVRDSVERKVVGLDTVVRRQFPELGHERPVAANGTLDKPLMGKPVQSSIRAVTRRGCKYELEVARSLGFDQLVAGFFSAGICLQTAAGKGFR